MTAEYLKFITQLEFSHIDFNFKKHYILKLDNFIRQQLDVNMSWLYNTYNSMEDLKLVKCSKKWVARQNNNHEKGVKYFFRASLLDSHSFVCSMNKCLETNRENLDLVVGHFCHLNNLPNLPERVLLIK
jgi:hypothetical protein